MSSKKFQNKYRIESARLKNYDYSSKGAYFITIVTKNRDHFFGEIVNGQMVLNDIGKIAQTYWNEIPKHFGFILLDEMVVMPNHVHGVLWICDLGDDVAVGGKDVAMGGKDVAVGGKDVACNVSTEKTEKSNKNETMAKISPKYRSLSSVIRSYKSVVTKYSREINIDFGWQTRFHDRIVRDENELNRIQEYIIKNPMIWHRDQNNTDDLWL